MVKFTLARTQKKSQFEPLLTNDFLIPSIRSFYNDQKKVFIDITLNNLITTTKYSIEKHNESF